MVSKKTPPILTRSEMKAIAVSLRGMTIAAAEATYQEDIARADWIADFRDVTGSRAYLRMVSQMDGVKVELHEAGKVREVKVKALDAEGLAKVVEAHNGG